MPYFVLNWKSPMKSDPDYSRLRVIGCLCYAAIKPSDKFGSRALKCVFIGYSYAQKAYKLFDLEYQKVIFSRDVVLKEHIFPYKHSISSLSDEGTSSITFESLDTDECIPCFSLTDSSFGFSHTGTHSDNHIHDSVTQNVSDSAEHVVVLKSVIVHVRKLSRISVVPKRFDDFLVSKLSKSFTSAQNISQAFRVFTDSQLTHFGTAYLSTLDKVLSFHEPSCYSQAQDALQWVLVMNTKIRALEKNQTWNLVHYQLIKLLWLQMGLQG